jgi:hypothetical protein
MTIETIKIFPPIGIARLGNSIDSLDAQGRPVLRFRDNDEPGEFFIGPEIPDDHTRPSGGYKDSQWRIKRQAARFRLFGYESKSSDLNDAKEITLANADIKWTVELANTKADWLKFGGIAHTDRPVRNVTVTGADRAYLRITPGARTLDSTVPVDTRFEHPTQHFNTGSFHGIPVPLGEMMTDEEGRLLVLGGFGNSASPHNTPIISFANNDDWYDDVSDGPVNASVKLKGTDKWIEASPAWVICAPPKFVPPINHIITLYDTLLQAAVDKHLRGAADLVPADPPSFTNDIYPILARSMNLKWVSSMALMMHPTIQKSMPLPGPDTEDQQKARTNVFHRLRNPKTKPDVSVTNENMPLIWSDRYIGDDPKNPLDLSAALTEIQYHILKQWKEGKFKNDWNNSANTKSVSVTEITPKGLTRAALESCVGGNFYPGIETSFMTRDNYAFTEPFEFRLDATQLKPGDLTKQMAVPWQADFYDCGYDLPKNAVVTGRFWWPAHRPEDVFPESGGPQVSWIRKDDHIDTPEDFVRNWYKFGFVIQKDDQYVESQREP